MKKLNIQGKEIDYDEFEKVHQEIINKYFLICRDMASYFLRHLNKFLLLEKNHENGIKNFICGNIVDSFKNLGSILMLLRHKAYFQATELLRPTIELITCLIILFRNTNLIEKYVETKQKILSFFEDYLISDEKSNLNKRKAKTKFLNNNEFAWAEELITDKKPIRTHDLLKYIKYDSFNNLYWVFDAAIHNSFNFYGYTPVELEVQIPISIVVFIQKLINDLFNEIIKYCDNDLMFSHKLLYETNLLFYKYIEKYGEFALYISINLVT